MEKQTVNGFLESFSRIPIRKADGFRAESQEYFGLGTKPLTQSSVDLCLILRQFCASFPRFYGRNCKYGSKILQVFFQEYRSEKQNPSERKSGILWLNSIFSWSLPNSKAILCKPKLASNKLQLENHPFLFYIFQNEVGVFQLLWLELWMWQRNSFFQEFQSEKQIASEQKVIWLWKKTHNLIFSWSLPNAKAILCKPKLASNKLQPEYHSFLFYPNQTKPNLT